MGRGVGLRAQIETPPIIRATPRLFHRLPSELDLHDEVQLESLLSLADQLVARTDSIAQLDELEWTAARAADRWPLAARAALKLARSKRVLAERSGALHLSVVVPLYAEHERIQRPEAHPHGEAFLDRKIRQLEWLSAGRPGVSWDLLLVDDGCPHQSGLIARDHLARHHRRKPARVVLLEEAVGSDGPLSGLADASQSRKGGAIHLGLWEATRQRRPGHVVLYTDADLSSHLGQAGLLVDALDEPGILVAAGSRRHPLSVVRRDEARSARGRLFIHLWKQMLPELAYVDDTQCGFKAMRAGTARRLVAAPLRERGFAFDVELLLRNEKTLGRSIRPVPIAWFDSVSASTTTDLDPYLGMLRSIAALYRRHCPRRAHSDRFAASIDALSEAGWARAVEQLGPLLERLDPRLDHDATHVSASVLERDAA